MNESQMHTATGIIGVIERLTDRPTDGWRGDMRPQIHTGRERLLVRIALLAAAAVLVVGCGGPDGPYAVWETPDGAQFVTRVTGDEQLTQLRVALTGDGRAGIPNGRLVRGDGGFNSGHEWHMVDVELAEMAVEVCDGTASMVDDVDYWVDTVGRYCPWDATIVAITDEHLEPWPLP